MIEISAEATYLSTSSKTIDLVMIIHTFRVWNLQFYVNKKLGQYNLIFPLFVFARCSHNLRIFISLMRYYPALLANSTFSSAVYLKPNRSKWNPYKCNRVDYWYVHTYLFQLCSIIRDTDTEYLKLWSGMRQSKVCHCVSCICLDIK